MQHYVQCSSQSFKALTMHPSLLFHCLLLFPFGFFESVLNRRCEELMAECLLCRPPPSWIKLQKAFEEIDRLLLSCMERSLLRLPATGPDDDLLESEAFVTNSLDVGLENTAMHGSHRFHSTLAKDRSDLDHGVDIICTVKEWEATS